MGLELSWRPGLNRVAATPGFLVRRDDLARIRATVRWPDVRITAVVLTLNEQRNIKRCLASLSWADEVVVVDSGSGDETVRWLWQAEHGWSSIASRDHS